MKLPVGKRPSAPGGGREHPNDLVRVRHPEPLRAQYLLPVRRQRPDGRPSDWALAYRYSAPAQAGKVQDRVAGADARFRYRHPKDRLLQTGTHGQRCE